jgi:hypothetical protein
MTSIVVNAETSVLPSKLDNKNANVVHFFVTGKPELNSTVFVDEKIIRGIRSISYDSYITPVYAAVLIVPPGCSSDEFRFECYSYVSITVIYNDGPAPNIKHWNCQPQFQCVSMKECPSNKLIRPSEFDIDHAIQTHSETCSYEFDQNGHRKTDPCSVEGTDPVIEIAFLDDPILTVLDDRINGFLGIAFRYESVTFVAPLNLCDELKQRFPTVNVVVDD